LLAGGWHWRIVCLRTRFGCALPLNFG
jgi:hypothetical protein